MAHYTYKVRDMSGKLSTGTLEAENVQKVMERLRDRNYFIVDIRQKTVRNREFTFSLPVRGIKSGDLAVFCRQLATMIKAGMPLLNSLDILVHQLENNKLKQTVADVSDRLESGKSFAEALRLHRKIFPDLFINMVEVGELGGVLDEVLEQLAVHYEREHDLKEKVKSAMTYPAVVLVIAILAVVFLLAFVLPTFIEMLESLGAELPLPTRVVIGLSGFMSSYWYIFVLFLALLPLAAQNLTNWGPARYYWHKVLLRLPVAGKLHQLMVISRFSRTLGTLLRSGVPMLQAMEVVKKTAGNAVVEEGVSKAQEHIREGHGAARPLRESGVFPPMVLQLIEVGEETGTLDDLLARVSGFYDREVDAMVARMSTIIEPILIVALGGVVGFIIISILLPMFSIIGAVG